MNNEPQMCNKASPPRTGTIRAIGAAAGYLALYFGIRFAATLFIAVAYFIVRLPADLETTYTLDLILSYIGEISFVEIISSTIAMFAAVWVIGLIRDRKKPLADHVGFFRDSGFVRFSPVLVPLLIVLGFTLNMFVSLMLDMLPIPEDILNDYAEQSSLLGETTVLSVLATAIFAPLSEELVFRGLLISRLRRGMPVWLAALIPSVIFGLIHGQLRPDSGTLSQHGLHPRGIDCGKRSASHRVQRHELHPAAPPDSLRRAARGLLPACGGIRHNFGSAHSGIHTADEKEKCPPGGGVRMITPVTELAATRGRILGVDFGDRRTGLAISDASRFLAGGIGTVSPGGIAATVKAVAGIAAEQGAVAAVVGLPRNMDGTEGSRAERCREFALMLADEAGIPVAMTDERLTTVAASRYLNETDTRGKKRKGVIDTLSAEIILQNTLDRLRNL